MYNFKSEGKAFTTVFVTKEEILKYVTQEEIYELVFKFKPVEYEYVTSPFRADNDPGCHFHYNVDGKLRFVDFGNPKVYKRIRMFNIDCFDAVQVYFKLKNHYHTLQFIYEALIADKIKEPIAQQNLNEDLLILERKPVQILFESRNFTSHDAEFWKSYLISKNNLKEDRVFPVSKMMLLNTRKGNIKSELREIAYAYTEFEQSRKKIYLPKRKGSDRFITNCKKNDIGNIGNLRFLSDQIIITKSYKDCRVLRNLGYESIWLQNEGMIPDDKVLIPILKPYRKVLIIYDNDQAGIKASKKLSKNLEKHFVDKVKYCWLSEHLNSIGISDPSDLVKKEQSLNNLNEFIKSKL